VSEINIMLPFATEGYAFSFMTLNQHYSGACLLMETRLIL